MPLLLQVRRARRARAAACGSRCVTLSTVALGAGAHRVQAEQRAGRHDDPAPVCRARATRCMRGSSAPTEHGTKTRPASMRGHGDLARTRRRAPPRRRCRPARERVEPTISGRRAEGRRGWPRPCAGRARLTATSAARRTPRVQRARQRQADSAEAADRDRQRHRRSPCRRDRWGERWGSNPRHPRPQPGALPAELRPPPEAARLGRTCRPRQPAPRRRSRAPAAGNAAASRATASSSTSGRLQKAKRA